MSGRLKESEHDPVRSLRLITLDERENDSHSTLLFSTSATKSDIRFSELCKCSAADLPAPLQYICSTADTQ